jgi:hypothetical protein
MGPPLSPLPATPTALPFLHSYDPPTLFAVPFLGATTGDETRACMILGGRLLEVRRGEDPEHFTSWFVDQGVREGE